MLSRPQVNVVIVTTSTGQATVRSAFPDARVLAVGEGEAIAGRDIVELLRRELAAHVIVCEGGPRLLGSLLRDRAVHQLFLTVAPQLAGRDGEHPRPALIEGLAAEPPDLPAAALLSVRRAADHLFLRYQLQR